LTGSGFEHRRLEEAGIRDADAFLALAHGDNRNILASQLARHQYGVETVVTRLYDPFRAEIFGRLGLRTFSPTNIGADLAYGALMGTEAADQASVSG
jgi:trk system potassium uptake protein TrkA